MAVSSGNLQVFLLRAQKMDEEFYGIFFCTYYIVYSVDREMRMIGDKEDDMWSRLCAGFGSAALKANADSSLMKLQQQAVGSIMSFGIKETGIMKEVLRIDLK